MFKKNDFYIDLGTTNTLIYQRNKGFIFNQPSVVAMRKSALGVVQTVAAGHKAKAMLGKEHDHLMTYRPLREGVIADFDSTAQMLYHFTSEIRKQTSWRKPRFIISLPCQVAHHEKKAVQEIGYNLGAKTVHLLHEPVAAAIGAGLPILENRGSMIVDIGGGTTEIAIISMGGIISSKAVRVGGDKIDTEIISLLESKYRFLVGPQTAEFIKIHAGSAINSERSVDVGGLNLINGLPYRMRITSKMIQPAVSNVVDEIIFYIEKALEVCPPEVASDLATDGLVLAGGGALIHGLDTKIYQKTGVQIKIAQNPLMSVAMGGAKALDNDRLFEALETPA